MTVQPLREITMIPDKTFPINIFWIEEFLPHWHDHLEWIYVEQGASRIQIDGDFVHLRKGEFAFVNAKQIHGATPLEKGTELVAIVFNEALFRNSGLDNTEERYFSPMLNHRLQFISTLKMTDPLIGEVYRSFTQITTEFTQKQTGFELFIKAELFRVFGLIFRHHQVLISQLRSPRETATDFTSLLKFLRDNYANVIRIQEAAKMVNLSPNHFCKVFKRLTGKTLIQYIQMLRVTEAERLLNESDLSITDIASTVGFNDMNYFGRVFKKYKNTTPSHVRIRH